MNYVVVTPARNEAQFIEGTIRSMVAQTVRPLKWVIVNDGSTDGTHEIVSRYAVKYPWIEVLTMPTRRERHFAGKVHAFNAGYARLSELSYGAIANMDADISFDAEYFAYLLQQLEKDDRLGLVGTPFLEHGRQGYDYRFVNIEHVSGACQLFRRECFEDVGGYTPVKLGGVDHVAVITARMKGWKTRTFTRKAYVHHRPIGTAQQGILRARFSDGRKDYAVGNHPLWEICRVAYQSTKRPFVVGGLVLFLGYLSSAVRRAPRHVPAQMVAFHRREQLMRLKRFAGFGIWEASS